MNIVLRLLFLSLFPFSVLAMPIQFTHTGVGSGVIGSITFQDAAFVITGTGDTDNLQFGGGRWIAHDSASIWIEGVGTANFSSGTRTWVNGDFMGFGRTATPGFNAYDLYNWSHYPEFTSWDMLTSFAQISGTARLFQWSGPGYPDVTTDLGALVFNFNDAVPATFKAVVGAAPPAGVPEPLTLLMVALGLVGIGIAIRRRAK